MRPLATNGDQRQGSGLDVLNSASDQLVVGEGNGPGVVPTRNLAPHFEVHLRNNFNKTQLELHLEASRWLCQEHIYSNQYLARRCFEHYS